MASISIIGWMLLPFVVLIILLFLALSGYIGYIFFCYYFLSKKDHDAYLSLSYQLLPITCSIFFALQWFRRCLDAVCRCWLDQSNQSHSPQRTTLRCPP